MPPMPGRPRILRFGALRMAPWLLTLSAFAACGLVDDSREEQSRYEYIVFSDKAFESYCLETWDLNGDGRISRYEAQRVRRIDCPDRGIASLFEIGEFGNLERLDCSRNAIASLDVSALARLEELDCSQNRLTSLDLGSLRGLMRLDCAGNLLASLDPGSCTSLAEFDGRDNRYPTLDVSGCSSSLAADLTQNPQLTLVYARPGQSVRAEGATEVVYR